MIGAWALFRPPDEVGALHLAGATFALYLGGSMVMLPYTAWAAELSPDYYERSRIAGAREAALVIGTLGAMAVPALFGIDPAAIMDGTAIALLVLTPLTVGAALIALPVAMLMTILLALATGPPFPQLGFMFGSIDSPHLLQSGCICIRRSTW